MRAAVLQRCPRCWYALQFNRWQALPISKIQQHEVYADQQLTSAE